MKKNTIKLDQLTSLRFFAALMIVFYHSRGFFGLEDSGFPLALGVSFFFVLSGFILTYVYPKLDTRAKVIQFWRARIARIYPAYLVSFLLGFWLIPYVWKTTVALPFILMIQGWIPISHYYFSYNAVSWSVSAEFFFYLAFPFILYNWEKTWCIKLVLSGIVTLALMVLSNFLSLPVYYPPGADNAFTITHHGLVQVNPLSRIFEFIFGMAVALFFKKRQHLSLRTQSYTATLYEAGAIILCALSGYYMPYIATFIFGILIYVMARGHGMISKLLSQSFLVLLGEISFSIYLIHKILLNYYRLHNSEFIHISDASALVIFFTILLLTSYLMWAYIEMPGRLLLLGHKKIHGSINMQKLRFAHVKLNRKIILDVFAFLTVIILVNSISAQSFNKNIFDDSNNTIYTLNNGNLTFNTEGLSVVRNNSSGIILKSKHNDPIITFPALDLNPKSTYLLHIQINVSKPTYLQIYYSDLSIPERPFTQDRVINTPLRKGNNNKYILLDYQNFGPDLRIDPATAGDIDINISMLEIRRVSKI